MQIIRPITPLDFSALKQIAVESGHGFTSLPVDDDILLRKIHHANHSFNHNWQQRDQENYLFVLEDLPSGEVIGTTAMKASVGLDSPLYHFRQHEVVKRAKSFEAINKIPTLTICNDYTGTSEICTLFLRENFRKGLAGRLLSRVRFLFMAQHPQRFADTIIAEMRGVSDPQGNSPFFSWLQTHFINLDFPQVDHMVGTGDTEFINQLMPKYPIFKNLLSKEAQAVIGQVHDKTKPALRLLEKEGFLHRGYVDLFDAGPTIEAPLKQINTVKQSDNFTVKIDNKVTSDNEQVYAICNHQVADFRALCSSDVVVEKEAQQITMTAKMADGLIVDQGDTVRLVDF